MLRFSWAGAIVTSAALCQVAGCSSQSVKTFPVAGKVEIKDGDVALLTNSYVEFKSEKDDSIRPSGIIDASGSFSIKTQYQGNVLPGAPEGTYQVRFVLADPTEEGVPKRKGDPIHKKYYEYATSKLTTTVPGGDYKFSLSKK